MCVLLQPIVLPANLYEGLGWVFACFAVIKSVLILGDKPFVNVGMINSWLVNFPPPPFFPFLVYLLSPRISDFFFVGKQEVERPLAEVQRDGICNI